MNELRKAIHLLLVLLLAMPGSMAAAEMGTIEGMIVDTSGAPIPGVTVEIKSPALLGTRVTATDASGRFRFPSLPPGTYTITATLIGFEKREKHALVKEGAVASVPFTLSPAGVTKEEVIVTGEAPVVDPTRATVGTAASGETIQKLPLGRSYVGVAGAKKESKEKGSVTVHGATSLQNQYVLDGVDTTGVKTSPGKVGSGTTDPGVHVITRSTPSSALAPSPAPAYAFAPLQVVNAAPFPDMFFKNFGVNPTIETEEEAVSTFSVDVDTASYALARSYLNRGAMPDPDGVRVEEFVNSFDYRYRAPKGDEPFSIQAEAFPSPHRKGYHVLHLGLKGREVAREDRKPATLVFCVDVSGSMGMENRLGLVKRALRLLVNELDVEDRVGLVVYGTNARVLLEPETIAEKETLLAAIERLRSEGSTNAQAGIREAYRMAGRHFRKGAINRVVLCSDGVANNGVTDADGIFAEVKGQADRGVTITTVGFGMANYNDVLMERLAQIGNGNYAYVDRIEEAQRLFVKELTGTLQVIAKDVKIQLELDPSSVVRYRLLGFENRALTKEEFENDRVDAGEIGAGHAVTALYELKLRRGVSPLGTLRIRYKAPEGSQSRLLVKSLKRGVVRDSLESASSPARLSFVAASFAEKLRASYWVRNLGYDDILELCDGLGESVRERPEVSELRGLIAAARGLDGRTDRFEQMLPVARMDFDRVPVLK